MPRIFNDIDQKLLPTPRKSLMVSDRDDYYGVPENKLEESIAIPCLIPHEAVCKGEVFMGPANKRLMVSPEE